MRKGRFLNLENIGEYNDSLNASESVFARSVEKVLKLDTTDITPNESSITIANEIMPVMRKRYISTFNKKIK